MTGKHYLSLVLRLMEEIPNNHLGMYKTLLNNGIYYLSTGAGFLPSIVVNISQNLRFGLV